MLEIIYYIGVATAVLIMICGVSAAAMHIVMEKQRRDEVFERVWPAVMILVACNLAAIAVLGIIGYITGKWS